MADAQQNQFSGPMIVFQDRRLPETATPAGYSALVHAYSLDVPLPRTLAATGTRHRTIEEDGWRILTPRHAPKPSLDSHLTFALKYEGLDLAVLKRLFHATGPRPIEALIKATPTGGYARRIWFLYEWLTNTRLNLPDAKAGRYLPVVDPEIQYHVEGENAPRYRVKNNLPGTTDFCPLVFRTETLDTFQQLDLKSRALAIVDDVPGDILARTAAFLLLKDSRSSYAIEGESPPQDRVQRWGKAIGEAGRHPLDREEFLRLQRIVIGDSRFVHLGYRKEGGFVGEHDRQTQKPLPDHISARHEDIQSLIDGLIDFDKGPAQSLDPVVAAALLAFGFVYIHPFEDGNGRIHRYLIHHILARRGFNPPGVLFPVSAAILERIDDYRKVLEGYSGRLLPHVRWEATEQNNVRVLNDTADFYRFFDATPHAEFLYKCVRKTIDEDLPYETDFLRRHDSFHRVIDGLIDMPERKFDLLFRFLQQNDGRLSRRAREGEFAALTNEEVDQIEAQYHRLMEVGKKLS